MNFFRSHNFHKYPTVSRLGAPVLERIKISFLWTILFAVFFLYMSWYFLFYLFSYFTSLHFFFYLIFMSIMLSSLLNVFFFFTVHVLYFSFPHPTFSFSLHFGILSLRAALGSTYFPPILVLPSACIVLHPRPIPTPLISRINIVFLT